MDQAKLKLLLEAVAAGQVAPDDALARLKTLPFEDLGFAKVDHHRSLRRGFPETIFCVGQNTRTGGPDRQPHVRARQQRPGHALQPRDRRRPSGPSCPSAVYHESARAITVSVTPVEQLKGYIAVVCAGTSDIPVAEEAVVTCEAMGNTSRAGVRRRRRRHPPAASTSVEALAESQRPDRLRGHGRRARQRRRRARRQARHRRAHQRRLRRQLRRDRRAAGHAQHLRAGRRGRQHRQRLRRRRVRRHHQPDRQREQPGHEDALLRLLLRRQRRHDRRRAHRRRRRHFDAIAMALESLGVGRFHVSVEKVRQARHHAPLSSASTSTRAPPSPTATCTTSLAIIERGALPDSVKAAAAETFRRIAECEARIHGTSRRRGPLPRGRRRRFHRRHRRAPIAPCTCWASSASCRRRSTSGPAPSHVAHGIMPVPAPATALLLRRPKLRQRRAVRTGDAHRRGAHHATGTTAYGPMPADAHHRRRLRQRHARSRRPRQRPARDRRR